MKIPLGTRTIVAIRNRLKRSLYWWDPIDGTRNVGDYLSKVLVEKILESRECKLSDKLTKRNRLLAIGSILHYASSGDCIWGTGRNGNISDRHHGFSSLDVRCVRGPLTRDFLLSRGVACPEVYGDPALLTPWIYPRQLFEGSSPRTKYVVVPHFLENLKQYAEHSDNLCRPSLTPLSFISRLVNTSLVVSSSLHGVILAEAYGVPAIVLNAGHNEKPFKYEDYFLGTGRRNHLKATSVDEALTLRPETPPNFSATQRILLDTFPFDLWPPRPT